MSTAQQIKCENNIISHANEMILMSPVFVEIIKQFERFDSHRRMYIHSFNRAYSTQTYLYILIHISYAAIRTKKIYQNVVTRSCEIIRLKPKIHMRLL